MTYLLYSHVILLPHTWSSRTHDLRGGGLIVNTLTPSSDKHPHTVIYVYVLPTETVLVVTCALLATLYLLWWSLWCIINVSGWIFNIYIYISVYTWLCVQWYRPAQDTCTGFLLGGIGDINNKRQENYLIVTKGGASCTVLMPLAMLCFHLKY